MLAGTGLGNHAGLAHAFDQQSLSHDVIGLVSPGMVEVLALDVDACSAEMVGQVLGKGQRGGAARVG